MGRMGTGDLSGGAITRDGDVVQKCFFWLRVYNGLDELRAASSAAKSVRQCVLRGRRAARRLGGGGDHGRPQDAAEGKRERGRERERGGESLAQTGRARQGCAGSRPMWRVGGRGRLFRRSQRRGGRCGQVGLVRAAREGEQGEAGQGAGEHDGRRAMAGTRAMASSPLRLTGARETFEIDSCPWMGLPRGTRSKPIQT